MAPRNDGRDAGTFAAFFGLLLIAGFLLFLTALIVPQVLGLVIVVGGFLGLFSLHYLLWGCWLSKLLVEDDPERKSAPPDAQG
jgi:hypothetical protein